MKKSHAPEPEKIAFSSFISDKAAGQSLLDFLTARFTYFPRDRWKEIIESGDVLLNGKAAGPESPLKRTDEVRYLALSRPEPKVPTVIPVLFEDQDLLIVNKPAHIPVHPGGRYLRNTLINLLKLQRKLDFLVLSHRLDRETSGVCVLTKTPLAKDKMYWQFFNHEVEKVYWALVWGRPQPPSGIVDVPIGDSAAEDSQIRIKKIVKGKESKSARTKYHTLGTRKVQAAEWTPPPWPSLKGQKEGPWPVSLVECRPVTGRTNQIRVHMAHLGCGLLGDKLYDPDEAVFLEMKSNAPMLQGQGSDRRNEKFMNLSKALERRLVLDAHALHATSLRLRHPRSGKMMLIEAPPPPAWRGLYESPR